jgi:hypothetical protein
MTFELLMPKPSPGSANAFARGSGFKKLETRRPCAYVVLVAGHSGN